MTTDTRPGIIDWALDLCDHVALRSRDPSTRVGAVIMRPDKTIASVGYNGFPRGTRDDAEIYADRPRKYARTVHAEMNAILTAREPLVGYRLYVSPLHPCSQCAAAIIQAGISEVIYRIPDMDDEAERRWEASFAEARQLFAEANVNAVGFPRR
jgi:dCMP deaminase